MLIVGEAGGEQKYFMYFYQPADVKDMTFMVQKHSGRDADRWLFVPAISMVRRIAARDKSSSFVGSDFSYEDVSGRYLEDDTHAIVKEEKIGTNDCVESMRNVWMSGIATPLPVRPAPRQASAPSPQTTVKASAAWHYRCGCISRYHRRLSAGRSVVYIRQSQRFG